MAARHTNKTTGPGMVGSGGQIEGNLAFQNKECFFLTQMPVRRRSGSRRDSHFHQSEFMACLGGSGFDNGLVLPHPDPDNFLAVRIQVFFQVVHQQAVIHHLHQLVQRESGLAKVLGVAVGGEQIGREGLGLRHPMTGEEHEDLGVRHQAPGQLTIQGSSETSMNAFE